MIVEALVRRKTQDMVRDAAATLLRETFEADLGGIGRIDRADLWAFDVDAADGTALVKDVLEDTTLVVNPNIHRYSLAPWSDVPENGTRLFVRVQDRVDSKGSQVLRAIRDRLGRPELVGGTGQMIEAGDRGILPIGTFPPAWVRRQHGRDVNERQTDRRRNRARTWCRCSPTTSGAWSSSLRRWTFPRC